MSHKRKNVNFLENSSFIDSGIVDKVELGLQATANTLVALEAKAMQVKKASFTLTALSADVDSGDDFGSIKIADLPDSNILILACNADLAVTVAGFATNQADTLDLAIGTAALASTDFSGTGEKDITDEYAGAGAAATGTADVHSFDNSSPASKYLTDGASNAFYMNVQGAVTSGTGTAAFTGTVDLFYIDMAG